MRLTTKTHTDDHARALSAVAQALSAGPDEHARVRLGAHAGTPPEVLYYLASDAAVTVRAAVALNPATPLQAFQTLAADDDVRVRAVLGRKLAAIAAHLSAPDQQRLERQAIEVLGELVADTAVQVRAAIADVLKDMPLAPRALILRLARDAAVAVSEPVIRLSPLLTQEDLLALLTSPPAPGTASAIARRPQLAEPVSDAIAAGADNAAIQLLLANQSAAIREATLDSLIARAAERIEWHAPLVRRPALSARAAHALAEIVATNLLNELADRADLAPEVSAELRRRLEQRLSAADSFRAMIASQPDLSTGDAMEAARSLNAHGELTEPALLEAIQRGQARLVAALLAIAAGVPLAIVDRAAALRSAKGVVSLAWRAGFSMIAARSLQALLARLTPDAILTATAAGGYPLTEEEMRWQLEFLGRAPR